MPAIDQSTLSDNMARNRRIMVVGEALLDHFPDGAVPGGSPFNVARHLAALGANPVMVTRIGSDADADIVLNEFVRFGMTLIGVQRDAVRQTGSVQVTLGTDGHQFHIGENQAWDAIEASPASAVARQVQPHIVCINTLAQRSATSKRAVTTVLDSCSALRVLDLNLREGNDNHALAHWSLRHVDVLKVNEDELCQLLHWFIDSIDDEVKNVPTKKAISINGSYQLNAPKSLLEAVLQLFRLYPLKRLLVTRGAQGYVVFDALGHIIAEGESPVVDVVDTVGAGDAFLAVTLLGEARGWPIDTTAAWAAQFAAAVCTHRGAVAANISFYDAWRALFSADVRCKPTAPEKPHP